MSRPSSYVLEIPAPAAELSRDFMLAKLAYHTDAWDVAEDLRGRAEEIVVVDARTEEYYRRAHIPGAMNFPHRTMTALTTQSLDRTKTYVVYCDGIGCNASTKGAYKLASFGFKVKELLGGLDFWLRDGHPVASGPDAGSMANTKQVECAC
ncbi:MAG TPA: rhodanese-like domain-containing protein [Burkholderiaceae bacterium]